MVHSTAYSLNHGTWQRLFIQSWFIAQANHSIMIHSTCCSSDLAQKQRLFIQSWYVSKGYSFNHRTWHRIHVIHLFNLILCHQNFHSVSKGINARNTTRNRRRADGLDKAPLKIFTQMVRSTILPITTANVVVPIN